MELSEDLINAVLKYLSTQPWKEANGLIQSIHSEVNQKGQTEGASLSEESSLPSD